jgi:hypothetical protein
LRLPCEYLDISNAQDAVVKKNGNRYEWHSTESGLFCLSRAKHVKFYSALVWKNGGWFHIYAGDGRLLFGQSSIFTGSFLIDGGCAAGLYVRVGANSSIAPAVTIAWMESD